MTTKTCKIEEAVFSGVVWYKATVSTPGLIDSINFKTKEQALEWCSSYVAPKSPTWEEVTQNGRYGVE